MSFEVRLVMWGSCLALAWQGRNHCTVWDPHQTSP